MSTLHKIILTPVDGSSKHLLELEAGDSGIIKKIEAGKELRDNLEKLGIKEGVGVRVKGHSPEEAFVIEQDGCQVEMCTGEASKLLVKEGERLYQLPQVEAGFEGELADVISGMALDERLKQGRHSKGNAH